MMAPGAHPGETPEMGLESRRDGSGRQKPEKCGDSLSVQKQPNCGHRRKT